LAGRIHSSHAKGPESIGGRFPQQVNGPKQTGGPAGREELDPAAICPLFDQPGRMEALGVLRGGGHVDAALNGNFIDAKRSAILQQPDDFYAAVVGESAGEEGAATVSVSHGPVLIASIFCEKTKLHLGG
jgi:hypothetical protein